VQTKTILIDGRKAVPIPDAVLRQCPLGEDVDVSAVAEGVLVKPAGHKPRSGWAEAIRRIPQSELDRDFEDLRGVRETPAAFDEKDWDW
jgi:hypothetical protein